MSKRRFTRTTNTSLDKVCAETISEKEQLKNINQDIKKWSELRDAVLFLKDSYLESVTQDQAFSMIGETTLRLFEAKTRKEQIEADLKKRKKIKNG